MSQNCTTKNKTLSQSISFQSPNRPNNNPKSPWQNNKIIKEMKNASNMKTSTHITRPNTFIFKSYKGLIIDKEYLINCQNIACSYTYNQLDQKPKAALNFLQNNLPQSQSQIKCNQDIGKHQSKQNQNIGKHQSKKNILEVSLILNLNYLTVIKNQVKHTFPIEIIAKYVYLILGEEHFSQVQSLQAKDKCISIESIEPWEKNQEKEKQLFTYVDPFQLIQQCRKITENRFKESTTSQKKIIWSQEIKTCQTPTNIKKLKTENYETPLLRKSESIQEHPHKRSDSDNQKVYAINKIQKKQYEGHLLESNHSLRGKLIKRTKVCKFDLTEKKQIKSDVKTLNNSINPIFTSTQTPKYTLTEADEIKYSRSKSKNDDQNCLNKGQNNSNITYSIRKKHSYNFDNNLRKSTEINVERQKKQTKLSSCLSNKYLKNMILSSKGPIPQIPIDSKQTISSKYSPKIIEVNENDKNPKNSKIKQSSQRQSNCNFYDKNKIAKVTRKIYD